MAEDPTHPSGVTVKIVGIDRGDRGRAGRREAWRTLIGLVVRAVGGVDVVHHISSAPNRNVL